MPDPQLPIIGRLLLEGPAGHQLSETRIRLLEAIDRHGSLSKAAKDVPLSYKAAWDALDDLNNLAPEPLVVRQVGGKNGGGSQLTQQGRQMIRVYRALEAAQQALMARMADAPEVARALSGDSAELGAWVRSLTVRTSARNQFRGVVAALTDLGGLTDVQLRVASGELLSAVVTPESVENMGLVPGGEAYAWLKAPSVEVSPVLINDPHGAWNHWQTRIESIQQGEGLRQSQLHLRTDGGLAVVSSMSRAVVETRGFAVGQEVWAMFRKDAVVLAVF